MKKYILIFIIGGMGWSSGYGALCPQFDDNANLIYVDCQTGQRVITRQKKDKVEKIRQRADEKVSKQKPQAHQLPKTVQVNGQTYYLSQQAKQRGVSGIEPHDWMISAYGGFGTYLSGESNVAGVKIPVKDMTFWSGGLSSLFFPTRYLGVGIGVETDQFVRGKT